MVTATFIDNAKVMAKGQVTIPKDVREILGVSSGDRITFVVENGSVRVINSAIYAMQMLQAQMDCSLRSSAVAVPFLNGRFPTQNGRSFLIK